MNDIMRGITERRTIRRFQDRQMPMEDLDRILGAAAYSPNAGNRQTTVTLVAENGIPEGYTATVHIALGYPEGGFPQAKARTYPERIVVG